MDHRPAWWLRALYRAPLVAYRLGLAGWEPWIGMHWIMIVTRGRRSGREYSVLVDVLGTDAPRGRYFIQSAYGRSAHWMKNIEARPLFEAQVGKQRFTARLEEVSPGEARRVMSDYVRAHRFYSPFIARMLGYRGAAGDTDEVASWLVDRFGMLAIVAVSSEPDAA
jgi:deazaflavin-dependent oxidoreductase (nitroreductase family)